MFADSLGESFKAQRIVLGLTRKQLAEQAGVPPSFVQDVERGRVLATLRKLQRMQAALTRAARAAKPRNPRSGDRT